MTPHKALSAYQSAIEAAPPLHAVVLLYDGALVRLRNACQAVERGDYGEQFNQIISATRILRGLLASLDMDKGGTLAEHLREAYEANMLALLASVGKPNALDCIGRIEDGLRDLRNAWSELAGIPPLRNPSP